MSIILIEIDKCDKLATRFYNVGASDKERAASDWGLQVKKVADMINMGQINSNNTKNQKILRKKI